MNKALLALSIGVILVVGIFIALNYLPREKKETDSARELSEAQEQLNNNESEVQPSEEEVQKELSTDPPLPGEIVADVEYAIFTGVSYYLIGDVVSTENTKGVLHINSTLEEFRSPDFEKGKLEVGNEIKVTVSSQPFYPLGERELVVLESGEFMLVEKELIVAPPVPPGGGLFLSPPGTIVNLSMFDPEEIANFIKTLESKTVLISTQSSCDYVPCRWYGSIRQIVETGDN